MADVLEFKPVKVKPDFVPMLACDCGDSALFIVLADKAVCPLCSREYQFPIEFEETEQ